MRNPQEVSAKFLSSKPPSLDNEETWRLEIAHEKSVEITEACSRLLS